MNTGLERMKAVEREEEEAPVAEEERAAWEADKDTLRKEVKEAATVLSVCVQVATAQTQGTESAELLLANHYAVSEANRALREEVRLLKDEVGALRGEMEAWRTAMSSSASEPGPKGPDKGTARGKGKANAPPRGPHGRFSRKMEPAPLLPDGGLSGAVPDPSDSEVNPEDAMEE